MKTPLIRPDLDRLRYALNSSKYTTGSTHNFYLYPARFSPEVARTVVEMFSRPGDWILDPFMGGGTAIIEGLALGRSVMGVDLNALAHFVATVRTTPLSPHDEEMLSAWARDVASPAVHSLLERPPRIKNLPFAVSAFVSQAGAQAEVLPFPRQRAFARCVLLRLGQWALDCRDHAAPSPKKLSEKLLNLTDQMISGLREFVELCRDSGVRKSEIVSQRLLLCRNAIGLDEDPRVASIGVRPRLVFTSPPYPRVHVLYHRWQVRGRKETAAPYWIAQVPDGFDASHYTGGSRTPTGERNYFSMIESVFSSVRRVMAPDGLVVQLIGFADVSNQLPRYLEMMSKIGFETCNPRTQDLFRHVPNRKWYAKLQGAVDASTELLFFHRPRRSPVRADDLTLRRSGDRDRASGS